MEIRDCRPRTAGTAPIAALLVLALLTSSGAAHGDFTLASQNCLHLGWGKQAYQTKKNNLLKHFYKNVGYDVIVLQEVMRQADIGLMNPGDYWVTNTIVQGASTYKEAYTFLVSKAKFTTLRAAPTARISTTPGFSRPPAGIRIREGNSCTWVLAYHAIFGRKADRLKEVKKVREVYDEFSKLDRACQHVVIAGDWNLAAKEIEDFFGNMNIDVVPTERTSLNPKGERSEPYDHCLATAKVINASNVLMPSIGTKRWRKEVSDHLGIGCRIKTR
ncbi:MAG TPA: hypothetical protein VIA62_11205 [Thermoanaerobaculia bacterium]|jgi:endonuclease/exonuclease/phosphatase family metal-dependent hydrolase|nr:hypothetical protein [Thermoanaerobaculia bacterium]